MKTKKVLSVLLVLAISIGLFGSYAALAAAPTPAEGEKVIKLYSNDFENNTPNEAPNLKKTDGTTDVGLEHGVVLENSENGNKYVEMKSLTKGNNFLRMNFENGAKATNGKLKIEFDIKLGDSSTPRAFLVQNSANKYFMNTSSTSPASCTTGTSYSAMIDKNKKGATLERNVWQHMSYTIDLDNKTVQLTISDLNGNVKSVSNEISNADMGAVPFSAMSFLLGQTKSSFFIDNIEIYNIVSNSNVIDSDNFEVNTIDNTPANWVGDAGKATVKQADSDTENPTKYLSLPKNTIIRKMFSDSGISSGKLYISLSAKTSDSSPRLFLVAKGAETESRGKMIGMWNANSQTLARIKNDGASDFFAYRDAENQTLNFEKGKWFNYKFEVDLDKKCVSAEVCNMAGETIGKSVECYDFNYIDDISVCGIGLRSMSSTEFAVDNVVISADQTAIDKINTGSNRAKIMFMNNVENIAKEAVTVQKVIKTESGVSFEAAEIESIEKLGNAEYLIEFKNQAQQGEEYMVTLADSVKYADGSEMKSKSKRFSYSDNDISAEVRFTTIPQNIGAKDEKADVGYTLTGNLSEHSATLYIVTYDENGMMLECSTSPIEFTKAMAGVQTITYKGFIPKVNYKTMRAFIWGNDTIVPLANAAAQISAPTAE